MLVLQNLKSIEHFAFSVSDLAKYITSLTSKSEILKTSAATSPSRLGSFNGLTGSQLFIGIGSGVELACALQCYHPSCSVHGLEHFGIKVSFLSHLFSSF